MADLVFHVPARVVFAPDAINRLGAVVRGYATRALLVTESILYERDTIRRAQAALAGSGVQAITFDEVMPNSTSVTVERAVALARASRIDAVVGMGGVRTLSCAKLVAAACRNAQSVDDILSDGLAETQPLPYVEVPSTCRNPFMLRDEAVAVDARDRHAMICSVQPGITREVVLDPLLALTIPAKYTAATMFDAFLHALEGYLARNCSFLAETLFLRALEILNSSLVGAFQDPEQEEHRAAALRAGLLLGIGLSMSSIGVGGALALVLNGRHMRPKSWIATVLLPHIMEFYQREQAGKLARLAAILGEDTTGYTDEEAAEEALAIVRRTIGRAELPMRLQELELELDDMVHDAEVAAAFRCVKDAPAAVSPEDLYGILRLAY